MVMLRPATAADVPALRAVAVAAYEGYVPRIGRRPAPMTGDYDAAVRHGTVWVAVCDGAVVGLVVLLPRADHGYLETHRAEQDGFRRLFFTKAVAGP